MDTLSVQNYLSACVVFLATVSSMTSGLYGSVTPAMVGLSIAYAINVSFSTPNQLICPMVPIAHTLKHEICLTLQNKCKRL